jgi:hypothetical protein
MKAEHFIIIVLCVTVAIVVIAAIITDKKNGFIILMRNEGGNNIFSLSKKNMYISPSYYIIGKVNKADELGSFMTFLYSQLSKKDVNSLPVEAVKEWYIIFKSEMR